MYSGEELDYRTPVDMGSSGQVYDTDIDDFSTLEDVLKKFDTVLSDLQHVESFNVLKEEDEDKAARVLLRQIDAKQTAYELLEPLHSQLKSAVDSINLQKKGI